MYLPSCPAHTSLNYFDNCLGKMANFAKWTVEFCVRLFILSYKIKKELAKSTK